MQGTWKEVVAELKADGYTGPTSRPVGELREILAQRRFVEANPGQVTEDKHVEWLGLTKGDEVRLPGDRTVYLFRFYFDDGKERYVSLTNTRRGIERCVAPELVQTKKRKKVLS